MPRDEWWSDFFSTAWPRIQASGYAAERTSHECDLISGLLRIEPGARVLDIRIYTFTELRHLLVRSPRALVVATMGPH